MAHLPVINMKTEKELCEMLSRDPHKVQSLCRICLCDNTRNATPLFSSNEGENNGEGCKTACEGEGETVCDKMVACGRVRINRDDKLPKLICGACHYDLDIAHLFRVKCQQADALLRKVLEDASVKHEEKNEDINNESKDVINLPEIKQEDIDDDFDTILDISVESAHTTVKTKKKRKHNSDVTTSKQKKFKHDEEFQIPSDLKMESDLITNNIIDEENLVIDNQEQKYICEICNKCMKTKYILAKHIKVLHGEDRSFRKKKPEIGPVTGHGAERRFHCPECDYKCRRRQTLQYHMTTHTGEKPFKCDQCPRSFAQHASLYTHKKTHSDKTYYTCQECGRQFKHYGIFRNHRKVHSNEFNFVCTICNKAMKTQKTLNDHMNRHLQIKQYSCEYCGRSFVTQSCLILHLRTHDKNKERKYKCTFCEFSFHSKGALDVHVKRHTGIRNFPCESCNHMCYTRGELKTHSRKHTKEQNYACPICDMKFRHSPSLNKHVLKKHGEKFKWSSTVDRRVVK